MTHWFAPTLVDRHFAEFFSSSRQQTPRRRHSVKKTEEGYTLSLDYPGVSSEDLSVEIHDGVLTITGKRNDRDFTYTNRFSVPRDVDADNLQATLSNGVLTVALPQAEDAKPRQIPVLTL